ncbi:ceramide synthase 1 LOH3-like isoform X2 [Malania oleifera]|uniref:ceramide synthase 1 LOH3-like isoform X2 n=1 Tax=Malania oleifera TaxID=397392 RepID=UPI0025ADDEBF|nr:ceramide synthase 1 LOH3-like isoform X2 [Malania oleifera]
MGFLGVAWSIDWAQESSPHYEDFLALPFCAVFFLSVRFFLDRYVFQKFARRMILGKGHALLDVDTRRQRNKVKIINKFKESAWKCVYFLSAEILAVCVTYDEPWFTNTKYFWVGPGNQVWPDQKIKFARVGSVVLALHDASDVFLEVGKMSKYSGCEWLSSCSFLMFVLCFTILRIVYYPFWIIRSTSYEVLLTLDMDKHKLDAPIYYYLFNTLLFCLLVIHLYWWRLMLQMLIEQIRARGKLSDDVRSDSEGDDEHND